MSDSYDRPYPPSSARVSADRPRPSSSMTGTGSEDDDYKTHIRLAALQASKARQHKIRRALEEQIASCDARIARLQDDGDPRSSGSRRSRPPSSMPDADRSGPAHAERSGRKMAEKRQQNIRASLAEQLETCGAKLERIKSEIAKLRETLEGATRGRSTPGGRSDDGNFNYQY